MPPRTTLIINDTFAAPTGNVGGQAEYNIEMLFGDGSGNGGFANLIVSDQVFVTNYNGISGDDFQVYYNQQQANYIIPLTVGTSLVGSPLAGLTNAQNWQQYGIAVAGAVAPSTATTMPGILGLVQPD
jgi:hypothetical protein